MIIEEGEYFPIGDWTPEQEAEYQAHEERRRKRWFLNCSTCGKFIPKANVHKGYSPEFGETCDWDCPHCGAWDGWP